jgi:hypothetical protein
MHRTYRWLQERKPDGRIKCHRVTRQMRLAFSPEATYSYIINSFKNGIDIARAFRTSESESKSTDFSEVRVRKFQTLKTLWTRTQRVCLFTHLYCKEVNISQKKSEISIFSFLKSYYSLYKPHAQISTIVKTS